MSEASLGFAKEIKGINNLSDSYSLPLVFRRRQELPASPSAVLEEGGEQTPEHSPAPWSTRPELPCMLPLHCDPFLLFSKGRGFISISSTRTCIWICYGATWHLGAPFPPAIWDLNRFPHCPLDCSKIFHKAMSFIHFRPGRQALRRLLSVGAQLRVTGRVQGPPSQKLQGSRLILSDVQEKRRACVCVCTQGLSCGEVRPWNWGHLEDEFLT